MTPGADADSPLPGIGLIGCGGISESHLGAYKRLGLPVRALCNRTLSKAHERAAEFFPEAHVCSDHRELLALPEVKVVDITTHPPERIDLIADALRAGKHVLSQKPFVLDLQEGERLGVLAWNTRASYIVRTACRAEHPALRNASKSWVPRNTCAASCIGAISSRPTFTHHARSRSSALGVRSFQ